MQASTAERGGEDSGGSESSSSSSHSSDSQQRPRRAPRARAEAPPRESSPADKPHLLRPPAARSAQGALVLLIARARSWRRGASATRAAENAESFKPPRSFHRATDYVDHQRLLVVEDLCAEITNNERMPRSSLDSWRVVLDSEEHDGSSKLITLSIHGSCTPSNRPLQKDDVVLPPNCDHPAVVESVCSGKRTLTLRAEPSVSLKPTAYLDCHRLACGTTARRELEALRQFQTLHEPSREAILRPGVESTATSSAHTSYDASSFAPDCCHASQRKAVNESASARDEGNKPLLVHGPPGTGKTHTVLLLLSEELHQGGRVKVCAPSNAAVDEIVLRLLRDGIFEPDGSRRKLAPGELVRVGPKEAISPSVAHATPDRILSGSSTRKNGQKAALVERACVVACTNSGSAFEAVPWHQRFDLMLMDEAAQATEPNAVLAMEDCKRLIFAGDHLQLPPTVQAGGKVGKALQQSLFERMMKQNHKPSVFLGMQFRMVPQIATLISELFYKDDSGHIRSADAARSQPAIKLTIGGPVVLAHIAGKQQAGEGKRKRSLWNEEEAHAASRIVRCLSHAGVDDERIGVITPYAAQQDEMRSYFEETQVESSTIDGFQGLYSLRRSD